MTNSTNLRTLEVTPSTGKDFRDTKVLDGLAKPLSLKGKNSTKQYQTSGGVPKGNLGGENTNS